MDHQRKGDESNPVVGRKFRDAVQNYFANKGIRLVPDFAVDLIDGITKTVKFNLGSAEHSIVVQCKDLTWTSGKIGSAKMKTLDELIFRFSLCPKHLTRILFMRKHMNANISLATEFARLRKTSIGSGIQIWEFDTENENANRVL